MATTLNGYSEFETRTLQNGAELSPKLVATMSDPNPRTRTTHNHLHHFRKTYPRGVIVGLGSGTGHGTVGSAGEGHGVGEVSGDGAGDGDGVIVGDGFGSDGFGLDVGLGVGETVGDGIGVPGAGDTVGAGR